MFFTSVNLCLSISRTVRVNSLSSLKALQEIIAITLELGISFHAMMQSVVLLPSSHHIYGITALKADVLVMVTRRSLIRIILSAGTLPAQWLSGSSRLALNMSFLDLAFNKLTGSIPAEVGGKILAGNSSTGMAAAVILDPMSGPFSMCGPVPEKMHVVSATGASVHSTMPGGQCPGAVSAQITTSIKALCTLKPIFRRTNIPAICMSSIRLSPAKLHSCQIPAFQLEARLEGHKSPTHITHMISETISMQCRGKDWQQENKDYCLIRGSCYCIGPVHRRGLWHLADAPQESHKLKRAGPEHSPQVAGLIVT